MSSPSETPVFVGVATLPERAGFFEDECLPSIIQNPRVEEVCVYHDQKREPLTEAYNPKVSRIYSTPSLGDAGKFIGYEKYLEEGDFYYFTCDDDLIYPADYVERMIEWIEYFERGAVVSLHGSTFLEFPVNSYYHNRRVYPCLQKVHAPQRVLFPGTGVTAFHSSTITPRVSFFRTRNMADIWFGLLLQKQEIPAVVLPHEGDYLTYNQDLPLKDTIWGQENEDSFVQTALVNQFSLDQGFQLFQYPVPLEDQFHSLPHPLGLAPEPRRSE